MRAGTYAVNFLLLLPQRLIEAAIRLKNNDLPLNSSPPKSAPPPKVELVSIEGSCGGLGEFALELDERLQVVDLYQ